MRQPPVIPWSRILAEGTIIAASILLAFWIDAWWDSRVERHELLQFLASFEQELAGSSEEIERTLKQSVEVLNTIDQVFLLLANDEVTEVPDNFPVTLGKLYKIHNPVLATGAYDDMVSSGNLRLIGDRTLSARINQYIQVVSSVRSVNRFLWDTYYDLQAPFLIDHMVISDLAGNPLRKSKMPPAC